MPAYQPFLRFLDSLQIKLLTRLLDSDMYLKAAESGVGIFEMDAGQTAVERRQFHADRRLGARRECNARSPDRGRGHGRTARPPRGVLRG